MAKADTIYSVPCSLVSTSILRNLLILTKLKLVFCGSPHHKFMRLLPICSFSALAICKICGRRSLDLWPFSLCKFLLITLVSTFPPNVEIVPPSRHVLVFVLWCYSYGTLHARASQGLVATTSELLKSSHRELRVPWGTYLPSLNVEHPMYFCFYKHLFTSYSVVAWPLWGLMTYAVLMTSPVTDATCGEPIYRRRTFSHFPLLSYKPRLKRDWQIDRWGNQTDAVSVFM